jgi:DMSO/TMAO reductase YedYZ molybdopterin-dependent catalytic subunit
MSDARRFLREHQALSRRFFVQLIGGGAAMSLLPNGLLPNGLLGDDLPRECAAACEAFLNKMEYLTTQKDFGNVSRGNPRPYALSDEQKRDAGLTRETWQLEVVSDPDEPATLKQQLTKADATALNWDDLMQLAEKHAVSFAKIMTCNNIGRPLGMGFWEGVPLREIIWLTGPKENLRRVFYNGFHNDDPQQIFRSSLPIGRVLEDPFDLPPVIVCYKLNGQFLNGERGGPVRMVVPEAYGFKSVKWLQRIVLSNIPHANDTYANGNNDLDSWMKTFARNLLKPDDIRSGQAIPLTGYAQVGISGLAKVQTSIMPKDQVWDRQDPYFTQAKWTDAHILSVPERWGGELPDDRPPANLHGFNPDNGQPLAWPMRLTMAHWATLLPGVPARAYTLRCRTIDEKGFAQPMPRPFQKSGQNLIEEIPLVVTD